MRACGSCGFPAATLAPGDAAVAARSFPRRYRELLALAGGEEGEALLRYRAGRDSWSVVDHLSHVSHALARTAESLNDVMIRDCPLLDHTDEEAPGPQSDNAPLNLILAFLDHSAERLAATIEAAHGEEWSRRGVRGGREVSALDLAREGVHEGVHHLREAERALDEARRQLAGPGRSGP